MFRKSMLLSGCLLALFVVYSVASAEDAKVDLKGIKCPVSGKAAKDIDGSSVAHNGGKVYFCCANCPKAFASATGEKKAVLGAKANHQLVATKQAKQTKCPIKVKPINPAQSVKVAGVKVGFC